MTLRLRLLLVLVGIVAVGLLVAGIFTYTSLSSYLYSQVDQQLQSAAEPVASVLWSCYNETPTVFGTTQSGCSASPRILSFLNQIPNGTYGQLRDADGNVLYSACLPSLTAASSDPRLPSSIPTNGSEFSVTDTGCQNAAYSGISETTNVGTAAGNVSVVLAVPLTQVDQTLGRLELIEVLVSLAVLAALGSLAWWIVRRGLRPLDEMTTTAQSIAAGDLSRRVANPDTRTEVGKLGAAFNSMLGEIEQAFGARAASEERLRRFLADASHELRTPLTSIRGYAELFDRGASERPEDLATSMRHIREDASRMSVLVEDLLLLARLDRQRPLARDLVDLAAIATDAVEAARVAAPDRVVSLESPFSVLLRGDGDRLRQVVDNLLSNALRHTPPATPVEVRVRADQVTAGLEVTDHGPGIPASEQERIFEPFHRADPSRARASGGVGLGLAIVSAIAGAHGGHVGVVSNGAGGATFWVQIPRFLPGESPVAPAGTQPLGTALPAADADLVAAPPTSAAGGG